jgi:uncharacterized membrane protein
MLKGYKTYITIILMTLYNIARQSGIDMPDELNSDTIAITINTVLAILGVIFNYIGRKRIKDEK